MKKNENVEAVRKSVASDLAQAFSGRVSEREADTMTRWNKKDALYQQEFLSTAHLLADMEELEGSNTICSILEEVEAQSLKKEAKPPKNKVRLWHKWAVAATLVLCGALLLVSQSDFWPRPEALEQVDRYVTRLGEQKQVNLRDGTVINLNTATELLVYNTPSLTRVTLRKGEAYFDVSPREERIFTVEFGDSAVTVLGTAFNIRKKLGSYIVGVTKGSVGLHRLEGNVSVEAMHSLDEWPKDRDVALQSGGSYKLTSGWQAELNAENHSLSARYDRHLGQSYGWTRGVLIFDNELLSQVIKELNRYSSKKIIIDDDKVMNMRISAGIQVRNDDMFSALDNLSKGYPIQVRYDFDHVVISASE